MSAGPEDVQQGEPDGEKRARSGRQAKARTGNDGKRPYKILIQLCWSQIWTLCVRSCDEYSISISIVHPYSVIV